MKLKKFFKVGKITMLKMTSVQNLYKNVNKSNVTSDRVIERNKDNCSNCIMYKKHIEYITNSKSNNDKKNEIEKTLQYFNRYCKEYCTKSYYTKSTSNGKKERLSRLQLCQLLLYHALGPDEKGFVRNISEKEVASILGCTVKTIRNNNIRLVNLNYILLSKYTEDKFNILLLDYKNYHLSSKEGGRGYITMSSDLFIKLIKINNVNSLRLEIRNLVKFDDQNVKRIKVRKASYTYKKIRSFLPDYMNYQIIKNKVIKETSGVFDITKTNEGIVFALKSEYNAKLQKKKLSKKYEICFKNYCMSKNIPLTQKDYDDLVQMSLEYRFNDVIDALSIVYRNYYLKDVNIENYGGLIREIIESNLHKKITA